MTKYCCFSNEVGVTLIGFLHLNAALYFWARASTFEPIYVWIDCVIAAMYTVRATYFFLMLSQDASVSSREEYYEWNKTTSYGLAASGVSIIILKWLEWSHPPTWTLVAWALVGLFNYYHHSVLQSYAGITVSASFTALELTEQDE